MDEKDGGASPAAETARACAGDVEGAEAVDSGKTCGLGAEGTIVAEGAGGEDAAVVSSRALIWCWMSWERNRDK